MLSRFVRVALFFMSMLLCWWALTEGESQSWWFGAPLAFMAAILMWRFWPNGRLYFSNFLLLLPKILVFFMWQSLRGGWDVAQRVLSKNGKVNPMLINYRLTLPVGWRRDFWLVMIGLMPGTLAVAIEGDVAKVHVLDKTLDVQPELVKFEYLLLRWL